MGSFASPGIGSGLNVNQLVSQLVAAERAPQERRIGRQEADARADLVAFGQVRAVLSALQGSANALDGAGAAVARKATVQPGAGFTASASAAAALGRYSIEVESLATAQKRQSGPVTAAETADLGTGTLSFTVGTDTFSVSLGATTTLSQLRDAINTATGGRGLSATVVKGDAGSVLVLNAATAGSAGAIALNATGSIADFAMGVPAAAGPPATAATPGLAVTTPAADARVIVDGVVRTSSTNRLTDLIAGVTLDLTKAESNTRFTLDVTADSGNVRTAVQGFISSYNASLSALRNVSAFNPETRTGGPLVGDAAIRGLQQALRSTVGGAFGDLSALGIRSSKDGSLTLDAAKLDEAIAADPAAVSRLFDKDATGSLGAQLAARLDGAVAPNTGLLESRSQSLTDRLKGLQTDRNRLDVRITRVEEGYRRQFTALDSLVAQLQSTQSFLTQQLTRLAQI